MSASEKKINKEHHFASLAVNETGCKFITWKLRKKKLNQSIPTFPPVFLFNYPFETERGNPKNKTGTGGRISMKLQNF
jgi:hypothetical protein